MSNGREREKIQLVNATTITKIVFLLHQNGVELLRLFGNFGQGDGPFFQDYRRKLEVSFGQGL
jgi:hypothetical protein